MKRLLSVAVTTLLALVTLTSASSAAVKNPRTIEVFYERDLVLLKGYPTDSLVRVEVFRGTNELGSFTGQPADDPVEGPGALEINHTGEGDCWQSANTPNIVPGDEVRTTIVSRPADQDSTFTRNVSIDFAATVFDVGSGTSNDASITLSGVAGTTVTAPIVYGTDVLELRLNKVNRANTWASNNRRDLREDVAPTEISAGGRFTHTFTGLTREDVIDARDNGVDQIFEWSLPDGTGELTVYDASEGVPPGCPPLGPGEPIPNDSVTSSPQPLAFGGQVVRTTSAARSATLTNSGATAVTITGFTVNGVHPDDFTVQNTSTCDNGGVGVTLTASGGTCRWDVTFTPAAQGDRSASIVAFTDGGGQVRTELSGTGAAPAPAPTPALSINNRALLEGDVGTKVMRFTVTRAGSTSSASSVTVRTADGNFTTNNATVANNDYEAVPSRVLTFAAGQTTRTVAVTINGDVRAEGNERFRVLLSSPTSATIADRVGIGTIRNDD